jgi:single-strand DNA-binding protein
VTEFTLSTKKGGENNKEILSLNRQKNTNFDPQNNGLPINDLPF